MWCDKVMDDESNVYMADTKAHLLFIIQFHFSQHFIHDNWRVWESIERKRWGCWFREGRRTIPFSLHAYIDVCFHNFTPVSFLYYVHRVYIYSLTSQPTIYHHCLLIVLIGLMKNVSREYDELFYTAHLSEWKFNEFD